MSWICQCGAKWSPAGGGWCLSCGVSGRWRKVGAVRLAPEPAPREPVRLAPGPPRALPPAFAAPVLRAPRGVRVRSLEAVTRIPVVQFPALLSEALGGIFLSGVLCVYGPAGSGKSTLAAELARVMARQLHAPAWWLDGDQGQPELIRECFERAGATGADLGPSRLIVAEADEGAGWRELVAGAPRRASLVVIDSVQSFTGDSLAEERALVTAARSLAKPKSGARGPTVILIIETLKDGQASGTSRTPFKGDATIEVQPARVIVRKCRWAGQACPYPVERPELGGEAADELGRELVSGAAGAEEVH